MWQISANETILVMTHALAVLQLQIRPTLIKH